MKHELWVMSLALVVVSCGRINNSSQDANISDAMISGNVTADTATVPSEGILSAFNNSANDLFGTVHPEREIRSVNIADMFLLAASKIALNNIPGPLSVQFKRHVIDNPLRAITTANLEPGLKIPRFSVVDQFRVAFGFPIETVIPIPAVPGLSVGLGVGASAGLHFIRLRNFADTNDRSLYNAVGSLTPEWLQATRIPAWIADSTQVYNSIRTLNSRDRLGSFAKSVNILTFPVQMPFTRNNIKLMSSYDAFSYAADGTISFTGNLIEGVNGAIPGVIGGYAGLKIAADIYATGKWKVTMQKFGETTMRVMVAEAKAKGIGGELDVGAELTLFAKTRSSEDVRANSDLSLSFLKIQVDKRKEHTFSRTYEYDVGADDVNADSQTAFKAYTLALSGRLDYSDDIISNCKTNGFSKCPVRWIQTVNSNQTDTSHETKIGILFASTSSASTVRFTDSTISIASAEIHTMSNVVKHTFKKSHLGFETKFASNPTDRQRNYLKPETDRREESFLFANESITTKPVGGARESTVSSILTKWNYRDNEMADRDYSYLENFFSRILGFNSQESLVARDLGTLMSESVTNFNAANHFAKKIPFEATMQIGILPDLIATCLDYTAKKTIKPQALLYKAFLFNPNAIVPFDDRGNFFTGFGSDMSMGAKIHYGKIAKQLNYYINDDNPQNRVKVFADLTKHSSVAPELFTFFTYLASAGANTADNSLSLANIFNPIGDYAPLANKLSTYLHVQSGYMEYNSDLNGKIVDSIIARMNNKNYEVTETPEL